MKVDQVPCLNSDCSALGLSVNHREMGPPIQVVIQTKVPEIFMFGFSGWLLGVRK